MGALSNFLQQRNATGSGSAGNTTRTGGSTRISSGNKSENNLGNLGSFLQQRFPDRKFEPIKISRPSKQELTQQPKQKEVAIDLQGEEDKNIFEKAGDFFGGAVERVKSFDFERAKKTLGNAVSGLPGQLKIGTGVILDGVSKQQKAVSDFTHNINKFLLPGPLEAINTSAYEREQAGLERTIKTGEQLRESGQKGFQKALEKQSKLGKPKDFTQEISDALLFNLPVMGTSYGMTIATGLLTKNPFLAGAVGLSTSYGLGASEVYSEARQNGLSDKDSLPLSMAGGTIIGAIDFLPLGRVIRKTGAVEPVKRSIIRNVAKGVVSAGAQSGMEGITEGAQEIVGNAIRTTYSENKDLFEGVGVATIVGAITGGLADVTISGAVGLAGRKNKSTEDVVEDVNKKLEEAVNTPEGERTDDQQRIVEEMLRKELTPDEALEIVSQEEYRNTDFSKEIVKLIPQAKEEGRNIRIDLTNTENPVQLAEEEAIALPPVIEEEFGRTETEEVSPTEEKQGEQSVLQSIPENTQEKANQDWEENYAEEYGRLEERLQELQTRQKEAKKEEREQIQSQIDEIVKQQTEMEQNFINEHTQKTEAPESSVRIPETFKNATEQKAFDDLQNNLNQRVEEYIQNYQNEVNPDLAIRLYNDYKGYNVDSFSRIGGALKTAVYDRLLKTEQGKKDNTVRGTAGGPGSGKTTTVSDLAPLREKHAIVLDTTFSNNSALKDVQKALDNGFDVRIAYTLSDPVKAWQRTLTRVRTSEDGRIVSEGYFLIAHKDAKKNILRAYKKYKDNPNVAFSFRENTPEGFKTIDVDRVREYEYNDQEVAQEISALTEEAYKDGRITEKEYKAIKADRRGSVERGERGASEPVSPKKRTDTSKEKQKQVKKTPKKKNELTLKSSKVKTVGEAQTEKIQAGFSMSDVQVGNQKMNQRPQVGKRELRTIFKNSEEFRKNPVLTVTDDKSLAFNGKKVRFKLDPFALGINTENIDVGNKIRVDQESLKGTINQMRVYKGGRILANKDTFSNLDNLSETPSGVPIIEFPEMVRIAKELTGQDPIVLRKMKDALGKAHLDPGDTYIKLRADIFKDPTQASKTLSHEIGHIADFLPDMVHARGNLVGRIVSLKKFMRNTFSNIPNENRIDTLLERLRPLQEQRRNLKDDDGNVPEESKKEDLTLFRKIREINKEIKELQKNSFKNSDVRRELMDLSAKWRPVGEKATGTAKDIAGDPYRSSPSELYADATSVLFNDPVRLKQEAPIFWREFFNFLERKPDVKKSFTETWNLINRGEEEVFNERNKELDRSFKRGEEAFVAKEIEKRKRRSGIRYKIKLLFDDVNTPIKEKVDKLRKQGKPVPPELNPLYALKGLNYLDGKLQNYVEDNFLPVYNKANEVADGWNQLGKIVFFERVMNERGELANPQGYSPETAQKQLDFMKSQMSEGEWNKLQEAKEGFRKAVQKSVQNAETNEFYTPDLLEQMKMNPSYATYQVIDYLDTYISSRVYQQVGTLKDIANPATSTIMKLISVEKAIERNNAKKLNTSFLEEHFSDDIERADTKWNGRSMEIKPTKDPDKELVITIEKGKPQGYYVHKDVAQSLNNTPNQVLQMMASVSKFIGGSPFYRGIFTIYNPGFQGFNFARDFFRYWKNIPDHTLGEALTSLPRAMFRYGQAVPHSYRRAFDKKDELIKEMENAKIIGTRFNQTYKFEEQTESEQIQRILERSGLIPQEKRNKILNAGDKALDNLGRLGDFIESLPKVAGYKELKGKMPEEELGQFIRTTVGSPDFRSRGSVTPVSNNIYLFSNAIKEGLKTDMRIAFTRNPSQVGFWWKTMAVTFMPKVIMAGMLWGMFGDELKEQMEKISEYDLTNYTVIPLGEDENGKVVEWRIPQDETGRLLGGLFWEAITANQDKNGIAGVVNTFFAFGAGQFPTLTPLITGAGATITYLSGKNPYDSFRGRNVIPETEFKAGWQESLPILLNWLAGNQGLSIVLPRYEVDDHATELEKMLNLPVVSNTLGRWIRVTDYGESEKLQQISEQEDKQRAKERLEKRKAIDEAVKTFNEGGASRRDIERSLVNKVIGKVRNSSDKRKRTNLLKQFRIETVKGKANPQLESLIYAGTNDEKVTLLRQIREDVSQSEFDDIMRTAREYKIISDNVVRDYRRSIR